MGRRIFFYNEFILFLDIEYFQKEILFLGSSEYFSLDKLVQFHLGFQTFLKPLLWCKM